MSFIADITNLVLGVSGILNLVEETITDGFQLSENIRSEVNHFKNLKFNPAFKNRVINAPRAVESTRDFIHQMIEQVSTSFHALISNLRAIHFAEEAGTIAGGAGGRGGGVLKILEDINKIKDVIGEIRAFFQSMNSFVDAVRQVRDELETLETIFLPQGNLRRVERLEDGTKIKIRLGNLHQ